VTQPYPGSIVIQQYLAGANWAERPRSSESFAPLIRLRPRYLGVTKHVEWQTASGDHTVPNVIAGNIYRAGHVFDLVTYYRNDKSLTPNSDPHGFLADPTLAGRTGAEKQLPIFSSRGHGGHRPQ
jgi:hypothetical protein